MTHYGLLSVKEEIVELKNVVETVVYQVVEPVQKVTTLEEEVEVLQESGDITHLLVMVMVNLSS